MIGAVQHQWQAVRPRVLVVACSDGRLQTATDDFLTDELGLTEYDERAVSIHIYSKPYDRCISYCRDTNTYKEVELFYTSIDGKLCDGIHL